MPASGVWAVYSRIVLCIAIAALLGGMTMACVGGSSTLSEEECERIDSKQSSRELITRTEAEEVAVSSLSESSPRTSAVAIQRIAVSCLTTLGWFEQELLQGISQSNPDSYPPSMPIWVIQVKGESRSEGPGDSFHYSYAVATVDATSGEVMAQLYRLEPLSAP